MKALVSVSDKTGLLPFVQGLKKLGWDIIATGGTQKLLESNGVSTINISDITGFPEILDGRVKTLHPKVHGGILARRDMPEHMKVLDEQGIGTIDLVCVNLYPFKQTIAKPDVTMEDAIDNNGKMQEAIRIIYNKGDLLYISIHSLHCIAKYSSNIPWNNLV